VGHSLSRSRSETEADVLDRLSRPDSR
jgi:hypothetical protein